MEPEASRLVSVGIATLTLVTVSFLLLAAWRVSHGRRELLALALGAVAWLGGSALLAESGFLARFDLRPPPFLLVVVPTFGLPLWLARSSLGKRLADALPLSWLIAFQGFRLPLELLMHEAAREGTMPVQMTFTGHNFDIVTGTSALLVAALVVAGRAPRALLIAWNVLGTSLLIAIVLIAIVSIPLIHAYGTEPAQLNTWVAYFPFVWLPAGLVASAWLGHLLLWRRLHTQEATTETYAKSVIG